MTTATHSLEELEGQITYGLGEGAELLYWHHQLNYFNYLTSDDQETYHRELKLIRKQLKKGSITSVKRGPAFTVDSRELYTMEVTMGNKLCYPYMLLRKRGLFDDSDSTPYFFTSRKSRDKAVEYITKR